MNMKSVVRKLHLYIGLTTGIIVMIIAITGCLYAFQKELKYTFLPEYTANYRTDQLKLPLSQLYLDARRQTDLQIKMIYEFKAPERNIILRMSDSQGDLYHGFLNPFTGKLLKTTAYKDDFFEVVQSLHRTLLLGEVGEQIIGIAVFLFLISLISGIYLWFPKKWTKRVRKNQFRVSWKSPGAKRNYDLHKVGGFYAAFFLIIIASTGLAWNQEWFNDLLYSAVTFEKKPIEKPLEFPETDFNAEALNKVKFYAEQNTQNRNLFLYRIPSTKGQELKVYAYPDYDSYGSLDLFYARADNGQILLEQWDKDRNRGSKFRRLFYDIHTGSILGIFGKILVFLVALIAASLPISGLIMYLEKRAN